jgi:putative SOS response-associated peptidase YedK
VCGRYSLATPSPFDVRGRFPIGESVEVQTRFNVAPGDQVLAVTTDREGAPRGELLRWGLVPHWAKSPEIGLKTINARAETLAERPAFRGSLERHRCLIIADGFYEWAQRPVDGGPKPAFHITREDRELFAFAGLWSTWRGENGDQLRTCTIVTTAANSAIARLHDRMPVILTPEQETAWLSRATPVSELPELLEGLPSFRTALQPVGAAVNDARYDGPECLEPPVASGQAALF